MSSTIVRRISKQQFPTEEWEMKIRGNGGNRVRHRVGATSGAAVLLVGALAAPAAASSGFDFTDKASYILDMRSAGVEFEDHIPAVIYQDVGYSEVNLSHDIGER